MGMNKTYMLCVVIFGTAVLYAHDKPLRFFELGLDVNAAVANSFLGISDVFNEDHKVALDLNQLARNDLSVNAGASADLFLNINLSSTLSFGIFAGLDVRTVGTIPQNLLSLLSDGNAEHAYLYNDSMDINANVFALAGARFSTYLGSRLKMSIAPAFFVPLVYMPKPSIRYTVDTTTGLGLHAQADAHIYSALSLQPFIDGGFAFDINKILEVLGTSSGIDLAWNVELELTPRFYLGASIINLPLKPALLNHSMRFNATIDLETDNLLDDLLGGTLTGKIEDALQDISINPYYDDIAIYKIARPLQFDLYGITHPFGATFLTLKINIGMTFFDIYKPGSLFSPTGQLDLSSEDHSFNVGVEMRFQLWRLLWVGARFANEEHVWKHSIELALNLHLIEIDAGIHLETVGEPTQESFLNSIKVGNAHGLGLTLGFRFGF
jgi:hypothetical protein